MAENVTLPVQQDLELAAFQSPAMMGFKSITIPDAVKKVYILAIAVPDAITDAQKLTLRNAIADLTGVQDVQPMTFHQVKAYAGYTLQLSVNSQVVPTLIPSPGP